MLHSASKQEIKFFFPSLLQTIYLKTQLATSSSETSMLDENSQHK